MKIEWLIAALLLAGGAANAKPVDGNQLHTWANVSQRFVYGRQVDGYVVASQSFFRGYIDGVVDALGQSHLICLPDGVQQSRLEAIIMKYLDAHPERWDEPAAVLVLAAV